MHTVSAMLKAFGHDTRLRILRLVSSHELAVNELVEVLDMPQPRVSRHLAVLRQAGLVQDRREGNWIYYRLGVEDSHPLAMAVWGAVRSHCGDSDLFAGDLSRLKQVLAKREARSRAYFDVVLTEWDRIRHNYIDDALSLQVLSGLVRADAVAVDIGAGTGEMLVHLARTTARLIGVDKSEKMLEVCRQRIEQAGLTNVELRQGDAEALPLADGECDTAFCSMLLHHLADPAAGVREMARIIRPGGKIVISELVKHDYDWAREIMADVWLGFTEQQIRKWLAEAGLKGITYWCTNVPSPVSPDSGPRLRAFIATGTKPPDSAVPKSAFAAGAARGN